MKRIWTIVRRDLLATTKDMLMIYVALAPLLLTLIFRLFLPTVGASSINIIITRDAPAATVEQLRAYADVEVVRDRPALDRRVTASDDAVGLVPDGAGGFTLVTEGNETHDSVALPPVILQRIAAGGQPQPVQVEAVAGPGLPYREIVGAFLGLSVLYITSILMGMHIIEDKESRMLLALGASPLSRREYVAARSLEAAVISTALVFACLGIMGIGGFNYLQALAISLVSCVAVALAGFVLGAGSNNQIAGVASMKFGFLLILTPPIASLFMPKALWAVFYWLPPFWTFLSFRAIFERTVAWGELLPMLGWNLLVSVILVVLSYAWLKRKLDFARN